MKNQKWHLYNELNEAFKNDFAKWNLKLDNDLSIKFTNPQVLFDEGKSDVTPTFSKYFKRVFCLNI
jgi:outer membrane protein OmpA-like peptidoglycan-associated protein